MTTKYGASHLSPGPLPYCHTPPACEPAQLKIDSIGSGVCRRTQSCLTVLFVVDFSSPLLSSGPQRAMLFAGDVFL